MHRARKSSRGPPTTGILAVRTAHSIHRSVPANEYFPSLGSISFHRMGSVMKSAHAWAALHKGSENWAASTVTPTLGMPGSETPFHPAIAIAAPAAGVSPVIFVYVRTAEA